MPFADFNRPKLDLCTNSQQKHCIAEQIFLVVMELLNNAHHIREMDLGIWGFASDLEIIYPKAAKCPFADFNRPKLDLCTNSQQKHCIGEQIFLVVMELRNNAHHIREMDFGDLPPIWK